MASETEWASKDGLMALSTKANGSSAKRTATANCTTLTVTSTRETGLTTKLMVKVLTLMQMGPNMSDNGKMINSTVLG